MSMLVTKKRVLLSRCTYAFSFVRTYLHSKHSLGLLSPCSTTFIYVFTALLVATCTPVHAANIPGWWISRNAVGSGMAVANDYAACNSGQLKWMALQAMKELDATLPGGAGITVSNMVNAWINNTANAQDYSAINAGQLKAVAAPFYDRLKACNWPCILPDGMTTNMDYPWSGGSAQDYSTANNGQVKYVFSFIVVNLNLTNLKFNHDTGSSANDAINIRQDYTHPYDISNGEWVNGGTNIPICYTTGKVVTIKARLTVQPATITSADVWAISTGSGGSLGNVIKTNVTFSGGVSSPEYVTFQVSGTTPNCIQKTMTDAWQWKMGNVSGTGSAECNLNSSGPHTVYTILNEPVTPWDNTYNASNNAWVIVLDTVCQNAPWAGGTTTIPDAAARITQQIYNSGRFSYDTVGGACNYTIFDIYTGDVSYFDLSSWMNRLSGGGGRGDQVNCWDCASGVSDMSNILGCDLWNQWMGSSFVCNEIRAIKDGAWGRPFPPNNGFSYHRVGWRGSVANSSKVFDACLKVDNDGDPTGSGSHNSELIPTDITFWTGSGTFDDYKQKLVDPSSYGNCNVSDSPGGAQNPGRRRDPIK